MKNTYVKPEMQVEEFLANQYVAACGDTEYGMYKFQCNAGGGSYGAIWVETTRSWGDWDHPVRTRNNQKYYRLSSGDDTYHACGESHESPTTDDYKRGLFDPDNNLTNGNEVPVMIWYDKNGYTGHATSNISRDSWEVVKS